ncbi:MAG: ATP-binding protein [Oligoflexia bacterium]|nr:ATP-binding protein [Oligoflexia bacterium]
MTENFNQESNNQKKFPFSAIVGQEKLKLACLINLVNPEIGGLLISGSKGTGKSTIVNSILSIAPTIEVNNECPFNCLHANKNNYCVFCKERMPIKKQTAAIKVITLPLSCTEDRLVGNVDIEHLLKHGEKKISPGILGAANNNILYIDEVNLLPDHLVDDILDVSTSKINVIEREGISIKHQSDFILIGSMNPEEGDLRPQILDRFPLCVHVETIISPELRVEVMKRNLLFRHDCSILQECFADDDKQLKEQVINAKNILPKVNISNEILIGIAQICSSLKVDGQRGEITIINAALALAALENREKVLPSDVLLSSELTLSHRTRDGGLLEPPSLEEIRNAVNNFFPKGKIFLDKDTELHMVGNMLINKNIGNLLISADKKKR